MTAPKDALVALREIQCVAHADQEDATVESLCQWLASVVDPILAASAPEQAVELWCLHVQGPDDVCPAPSKAHAQKAADMLNEAFKSIEDAPRAVAALWPHSPESHAEAVGAFIVDWLIPRAHIDALQAGLRPAGLSDATRVADDVMHGWRLGTSGVAEQDARKLAEKLQGSAHNAAYDLAEKFMKRVHQLNREAATQADDPVMNNWLAGQALAFNEAAECVTYATTWPKPATHRPADAAVETYKHIYYGAGEADCPKDIKAPNGELHTMRCRACGQDNPARKPCLPADAADSRGADIGRVDMRTTPQTTDKPGGIAKAHTPQHGGDAVEACDQSGGRIWPITEEAICALVAGPYMWHHKMNERQELQAKAFDRCREITLEQIATYFATRNAALAADKETK